MKSSVRHLEYIYLAKNLHPNYIRTPSNQGGKDTPNQKWAKDLRRFLKDNIQKTNKHEKHEKILTIIHQQKQIKTTIRSHFTLTRLAKI